MNIAEELVENTTRYSALEFLCKQYPDEIRTKTDYFYAVPYYFAVRFQDWNALERIEPKIEQGLKTITDSCAQSDQDWKPLAAPYTRVMAAYAKAYRQLALNGLDNTAANEALKGYWQAVTDTLKATPDLNYGNNKATELFRIANLVLLNKALDSSSGKLDLASLRETAAKVFGKDPSQALATDLKSLQGDHQEQIIGAWRKAVAIQDALNYNEPPDWYYTLRESLGYALLAQGKADEAEKVFRQDLAGNRLSGRSLNGLKLSLRQQPGKTVPALLDEQLQNAWRNATISAAPSGFSTQ